MELVYVNTSSFRFQVQKLFIGFKVIFWINAYFSVDDEVNTDKLEVLLVELKIIININGVNKVILGGDKKYDMTKMKKSALQYKYFLEKMDPSSVGEQFNIDFNHHHIDFNSCKNLKEGKKQRKHGLKVAKIEHILNIGKLWRSN